jgi:hypothetical protein
MDLHTDPNDELHEHLEHIPWSDLTTRREIPRWIPYVAAGVIAVAALGVFLGKSAGSTRSTIPIIAVTSSTTAPDVAATLPEAAPLYSEADLMALVPGSQEQLAATRAVWFVREYFGTGGRPGDFGGVLAALPAGAVIESEDGGGSSYVEWAEPFSVEQLGDDLYRVGVVFGMLGGQDASTLTRLEPSAVVVVVAVDGDQTGVVDLPMPIELPSSTDVTVWPDASDDVPESVIAAAEREVSKWGDEPEVIDASHGDGGWRVEVVVSDTAGIRWPMAVWIDGTDRVSMPPWETGS